MRRLLVITTTSLIAALFLLAPSRVAGEDIEIRFEADIYSFPITVLQPCMGKDFDVNDILKGVYIYSTDVDDSNPADEVAEYDYDVTPYGMQLQIGSQAIVTDPKDVNMRLGIHDGYTGGSITSDTYFVESFNNLPLETGGEVEIFKVFLSEEDGSAIDSVELPAHAPVLSDWSLAVVEVVMSCYPSSFSGRVLAHITYMRRVYPMDDLVEAINALLESSPLDARQNGLLSKLARTTAKFDRGKDFQACKQFQAFIYQFERLLWMFDEPYYGDAKEVLEQAELVFESRCAYK